MSLRRHPTTYDFSTPSSLGHFKPLFRCYGSPYARSVTYFVLVLTLINIEQRSFPIVAGVVG